MADKTALLSRETPWREVIILCRKCGKKLDGGFGLKGTESLKTELRQALRETGQRRQVRVMETACLGVCPKNGVTALNATRPGVIHIIPAGSDGLDATRILLGGNTVVDRASGMNGVEAA